MHVNLPNQTGLQSIVAMACCVYFSKCKGMPGLDHQLLTSVIFEKARGWIPSNCCYIDILKISLCQRKIPAMIKVWVRKNKSTHALPMAFYILAFFDDRKNEYCCNAFSNKA